jgi:hypothetical protein
VSDVVPVTALMRRYRKSVFDFSAHARKEVERHGGVAPTCKNGCAYCCYPKIVINVYAGAMIFLHLRSEGRWTPAMKAKLIVADAVMTPIPHDDYLAKRIPCVFLKEDSYGHGSCSVHPARPFECATTFSDVADPSLCGVPGGQSLQLVQVDPDIIREQILFGFDELLDAMGEQTTHRLTLPGAVLYAGALLMREEPPPLFKVCTEDHAGQDLPTVFDQLAWEATGAPWVNT